MKATKTLTRTEIIIETEVEVDDTGRILAKAHVLSHGSAQHLRLGQLHGGKGEWWITDLDGHTVTFDKTRRDVLKRFEDMLTGDAAKWAA